MTTPQRASQVRPSEPEVGRCRVMGILNVTPEPPPVGGESTRPGADRVAEDEELRRVVPVVRALSSAGAQVSVDTTRASVAAAAVHAGATLVNDVSGGLTDPDMLPFIAHAGVPCVLMHWRAHSKVMQQHATYRIVVEDVRSDLARRCDAALTAGIGADRIILDPGLGFAKTADHSWSLLARLPRLMSLGFPVLVGASRKAFLGECVDHDGLDAARPADRDGVSAAVASIAAATGVWGVRVHDVPAAAAASRVAARLAAARTGE